MALNKNDKAIVLNDNAIKFLCNCIKSINSLSTNLIDDLNKATNTTNSSVYIDKLIAQALSDANNHSEKLIASIKKLTCAKTTVQPTLDNSELNIIYLYSETGNAPFNQFLKISSTELIDLGSTNISFDEYLKITDAVKKYATKTDLEATNTTVTNHINNTDVHITSTERTKWDKFVDESIKTYTKLEQLELASGCSVEDIFSAMPNNSYLEIGCNQSSTDALYYVSNTPVVYGLLTIRKYDKTRFAIEYKLSGGSLLSPNELYIGQLKGLDGTGLSWSRVCTTKITDVEQTKVTIVDSKTSGNIYYEVKNGVCHVSGQQIRRTEGTGDVATVILVDGLPKCSDIIPVGQIMHYSTVVGNVWMASNSTQLKIACPSDTGNYCLFNLSYPVSES